MRLPEAVRSLRSRDFRAFFGAQTLTQIATYMRAVADAWLVLSLMGYASVITSAGCNTVLQLDSSDALRGRVMGLHTLIHGGCFPIAAPLIGAVAERWSVSTAFFIWGAGGLAMLAVLMGAQRRRVVAAV